MMIVKIIILILVFCVGIAVGAYAASQIENML